MAPPILELDARDSMIQLYGEKSPGWRRSSTSAAAR